MAEEEGGGGVGGRRCVWGGGVEQKEMSVMSVSSSKTRIYFPVISEVDQFYYKLFYPAINIALLG